MNHPPPNTHPEDLEYIDTQIRHTEQTITVCDATIQGLHDKRDKAKAQLVQLNRIRDELARATVAETWWDSVLVFDLVPGDVFRFTHDTRDHTVASLSVNGDGRMVLRTDISVTVHPNSDAVRVRFPRPMAPLTVVADVHDLVERAVGR